MKFQPQKSGEGGGHVMFHIKGEPLNKKGQKYEREVSFLRDTMINRVDFYSENI